MPAPRPGEDKQAYVARFMSSAEAQKDYPDEKQRAAVAYSMFGEKKNNMDICGDCGAETNMNPAGTMSDCTSCGRQMHHPTPAIEGLGNMCPSCRHPMKPEHDDFGCHIPGCGCVETGASFIDKVSAVLPNAAEEKKNASPESLKALVAEWKKRAGDSSLSQEERDQARTMQGNVQDQLDQMVTAEKKLAEAEKQNASHPAMEAFEAHVQNCNTCSSEYANANPNPDKLCAEGHKLLMAGNLENAGKKCLACEGRGYAGNGDRCAECGGSGNANAYNAQDKKLVLEEIAKIEKEIADLRAKTETPENAKTLQAKETTLAGLRRELSNAAPDLASAREEYGTERYGSQRA